VLHGASDVAAVRYLLTEAGLYKAQPASIDRLTDQAHIATTGADSYRFRRTTAQRTA
jgi:hypothetical protein